MLESPKLLGKQENWRGRGMAKKEKRCRKCGKSKFRPRGMKIKGKSMEPANKRMIRRGGVESVERWMKKVICVNCGHAQKL